MSYSQKAKSSLISQSVIGLISLAILSGCSPKEGQTAKADLPDPDPAKIFALARDFYRDGDFVNATANINLIDTSSIYWDSARIMNDSIITIEGRRKRLQEIEGAKLTLATLNEFDGKYYFNEISSLISGVNQIKDFERAGERMLDSEIPEVVATGKKIKAKAAEVKKKWMPLYRKEAGRIFDQNLWREDIDVKAFGTGYKTLEYVGVFFAANANIEDFHHPMSSIFRDLGFTRIQYRWYEGSEYTYYTLK